MYSRRDVGRFALGGLALRTAALVGPAGSAFAAKSDGASGVRLGATTWSLRDLPRIPGKDNIDDLIRPLKSAGVAEIDLWSYNTEPAGPNTGPGAPPPPAAYPIVIHHFTPEEIAAAMLQARNLTRDYRLSAGANHYADFRAKFAAAGISVAAYTVKFDETFTDPEIDAIFVQAKSLGAASITAPGNSETLQRLAAFAEKHEMNISATDYTLAGALPSKLFKLNADIGAITAANGSPLAWIQENHDAIGQLTIKDRRRNKGKNEQFGDGDTPVQEVLRLVKDKRYTFPVFAEYEYLGLGTPAEELQRCMDYMRSVVA
jgi:sugar phosphate isomerase/epimerase